MISVCYKNFVKQGISVHETPSAHQTLLMILQNVWWFNKPSKLSFSWLCNHQGPDSIKICHLTSIGNPIVEIRRSKDRLISTMGFPILVRCHLYIESGPSTFSVDWHTVHAKPIPEPKLIHCQLINFSEIVLNIELICFNQNISHRVWNALKIVFSGKATKLFFYVRFLWESCTNEFEIIVCCELSSLCRSQWVNSCNPH